MAIPKCDLCTDYADLYMLKDKVWLSAVPEGKGRLCIFCFERLLGRPLTIDDFTDSVANRLNFFMYEIGRRSDNDVNRDDANNLS